VVTVVYDNNPFGEGLEAAWGFACVVRGLEKTILFDTGGNAAILLENMKRLDIDPGTIDVVVLSHDHGDHTGGLWGFLNTRGSVPVWTASGFSDRFREHVRGMKAPLHEAAASEAICEGARTTGTLGLGRIEEHGLCVRTAKGWVLITGCAHPGIADMTARARDVVGEPVHMVLGGFHMRDDSHREIDDVIGRLTALKVERVGPCHCTGDRARKLFKKRYGDGCLLVGVGSVLDFPTDEVPVTDDAAQ